MSSASGMFDVAIVGLGPVGAVAANLLGQGGLRTLVVDREREIYDKPRAVALDHEIARVLQGLGLADALDPFLAPFTASEYFGVNGQLIKRLDMVPPPYPQAWTPSMVFMQPAVEQLLRKAAIGNGNIEVRLGQEVHSISQSDHGVVLGLRDEGGKHSTVSAQYVVACDGASSTVRQALAIELEDLGFDQPWLVVDIIVNARGLEKLPQTSVQYCEPRRPTTFVMGIGAHRRWEIMLDDDEDPQSAEKPENVWRYLRRWITPEDGQLWRSASYRFHALVARQWQIGRIFVAGDAAHQQPPFLGQGFCQGGRDVANLCWKLERVLSGQSHPGLLLTYGIERAAHVRKLTGIIKSIGGLVAERDLQRANERDARLIAEAGGFVHSMPRQDLMPGLECGLLSRTRRLGVGSLFPQPWVVQGGSSRRFDDFCGRGFLVVFGGNLQLEASSKTIELCRNLNVKIVRFADQPSSGDDGILYVSEREGVATNWFTSHNCIAAIVRPDKYVFALASSDDELTSHLSELALCLA
jgi:3-(3-hydroxy-phenyl)propionate hydroxylase